MKIKKLHSEELEAYNESDLEESLLNEMALIGEFKPKYEVRVYGKEGPVPHFHISNPQTKEYCCLKICEAGYFNHSKYMTKFLTSKDLTRLNEWLKSVSNEFKVLNIGLTIYDNICILWNQNNPLHRIEIPSIMPDYEEVK